MSGIIVATRLKSPASRTLRIYLRSPLFEVPLVIMVYSRSYILQFRKWFTPVNCTREANRESNLPFEVFTWVLVISSFSTATWSSSDMPFGLLLLIVITFTTYAEGTLQTSPKCASDWAEYCESGGQYITGVEELISILSAFYKQILLE